MSGLEMVIYQNPTNSGGGDISVRLIFLSFQLRIRRSEVTAKVTLDYTIKSLIAEVNDISII
jgi:hypothetical protein